VGIEANDQRLTFRAITQITELSRRDVQQHDEKLNKQSLCEKEIENFAICGSNHYHKF
jgi:hypothetical protein